MRRQVKLLLMAYILLIRSRVDPPTDVLPPNIEIAAKVTRMNLRYVKDKTIDLHLSNAMKTELSHTTHCQYMSQSTRDQPPANKEGKEMPEMTSHSSFKNAKGSYTPKEKRSSFVFPEAVMTNKGSLHIIRNTSNSNRPTIKFDYLFAEDRCGGLRSPNKFLASRLTVDHGSSTKPVASNNVMEAVE